MFNIQVSKGAGGDLEGGLHRGESNLNIGGASRNFRL